MLRQNNRSFLRSLTFFLFVLFTFSLISACQKEDKKVAPKPEIVVEPLPPITQKRIDLWIDKSGELAEYIKRFALKVEEVSDKRELMMLVHGSSRTQLAYSEIFDKADMDTKEFWNILQEMKKAKKYLEIKKDEEEQNLNIKELIEAGRAEITILNKKKDEENSPEKRLSLEKSISAIKAKIAEFEELSGDISAKSVGIEDELLRLWNDNKVDYEKALESMWKLGPEKEFEPYRHF